MVNKNSRIFIAGHKGLIGSAIYQALLNNGYNNILIACRSELELKNNDEVELYFKFNRPDIVILCAARAGGILDSIKHPVEFIYDNVLIQNNIISSCAKFKIKKFIFFSSSCIYPKNCPQPIKEDYVLSSQLDDAYKGYALAKLCGMELCNAYKREYGLDSIIFVPCNVYGFNDRYDEESGRSIGALIKKIVLAKFNHSKEVTVWGSGLATREYINSFDVAEACLYFLEKNILPNSFINLGTGIGTTIAELVSIISEICGYNGKIIFDHSKPEGVPKKVLDISKILSYKWKPKISLQEGLKLVISDFISNIKDYS